MIRRDLQRPRLWLGVWLFGWALCIALSLLPPIELDGPPDSDKLGHFLAYFTLSAWAAMLFEGWRARVLVAGALMLLGLGLELAQATLTTTRQGDARDMLANALGVMVGLGVALTPGRHLLAWLDAKLRGEKLRD
ncbi:VanZ family protein [Arenimonas sp.]|uniref:VanZ family protein n=1 Tax=Arenimonas sp. TaxID=1872635 RepID=UPI0025BF301C|nr:VanZ family protein [Arenimonas sp.]